MTGKRRNDGAVQQGGAGAFALLTRLRAVHDSA